MLTIMASALIILFGGISVLQNKSPGQKTPTPRPLSPEGQLPPGSKAGDLKRLDAAAAGSGSLKWEYNEFLDKSRDLYKPVYTLYHRGGYVVQGSDSPPLNRGFKKPFLRRPASSAGHPQGERERLRHPSSLKSRVQSCHFQGDQKSGLNRICWYSCMGTWLVQTIHAFQFCRQVPTQETGV